jgi:hypothetical protein
VGAHVEVVEVVVIVAVAPFLLVAEEATVAGSVEDEGVVAVGVVVEQLLIFESFGTCLGTWSFVLLLTSRLVIKMLLLLPRTCN